MHQAQLHCKTLPVGQLLSPMLTVAFHTPTHGRRYDVRPDIYMLCDDGYQTSLSQNTCQLINIKQHTVSMKD